MGDLWGILVLVGSALVAAAWFWSRRTSSAPGAISREEWEAAFDRLFLELEEENRKFAAWLADMRLAADERFARLEERVRVLEKETEWLKWDRRPSRPDAARSPAVAAEAEHATAATRMCSGDAAPGAATGIRGRYPELFRLHGEGKSTEQIARKLGMNKGEVMLILEFARREEQPDARP